MKKVALLILFVSSNVVLFCQQTFIDYVILKPQVALTKEQENEYSKLINKGITPGILYPVVQRSAKTYDILIMYLTSNENITADTSCFVLFKKLPQKERKQKLLQLLDLTRISYKKYGSKSYYDSTVLLDDSYVSYGYSATDSIYENIYGNAREEITRFWYDYKDAELLSKWMRFIYTSGKGEDGMDGRYLAYCYFKYPLAFITVLKKQSKKIKEDISFYITGSSGFEYATITLHLNYKKEMQKFIDMAQ